MADDTIDIAIIGAGIVGCAIAALLGKQKLSIILLEKETQEATGITSRNSGVIHSGIYYPPQSLKSRFCTRGQELLYDWVKRDAVHVPYTRIGKLIVAKDESEDEALQDLYSNAVSAGAKGCSILSSRETLKKEPHLSKAYSAMYCKHSGIVDPHAFTHSLLAYAGHISPEFIFAPKAELLHVDHSASGWTLNTSRGSIKCRQIINCAGLAADKVAALLGFNAPPIYPCRGDYFRLHTTKKYKHLIYPVRKKNDAGLGVHLTHDTAGALLLGPDAEFITSRSDFSSGEHKLKHFYKAAIDLLGEFPIENLHWESCGIRPKLRAPHETVEKDFFIEKDKHNNWHLVGIESPGLTSALAIAEYISTDITETK